jgi:hypothetical protein
MRGDSIRGRPLLWLLLSLVTLTIASGCRPATTPTPPGASAVAITEPQGGAVLDPTGPIHVAGTGQGLFEGNVVVQVLGADGSVLAEQATILQGEDVGLGGAGVWEVELVVEVEPGAAGQIVAFSPSPEDGSIMASDSVTVTFGTE